MRRSKILAFINRQAVADVFAMQTYIHVKYSSAIIIFPVWILLYLLIRIFGDNSFFDELVFSFISFFDNRLVTGIIFGLVELVVVFIMLEMISLLYIVLFGYISRIVKKYLQTALTGLISTLLIYNIPTVLFYIYTCVLFKRLVLFNPVFNRWTGTGLMAHLVALYLWMVIPPILYWYQSRRKALVPETNAENGESADN